MPPSADEAIHLVTGSAARGQVMALGARRRIYGSDDQLVSGPCDVDPARHAELRRAWDAETAPRIAFRRPPDLSDLRTAIAGDDPVVLWATRAYSDLVWLWWALDGLGRIGADPSRFFLARPEHDDLHLTVGHSTPDQARIALAAAQPVTAEQWREGSELWIEFASPSPLAFDQARRAGSSAFPELTRSAEPHGAWFPRSVDGQVQLAELDRVLLAGLADAWRTTQEVLAVLPDERLASLLAPSDGFFPVERLRAWADHGVLEREVVFANDTIERNPWHQDRFRATDRVRALLAGGLARVDDAPPMYVGGCRVNDPTSPWVRIESDAGWRLAALSPAARS